MTVLRQQFFGRRGDTALSAVFSPLINLGAVRDAEEPDD
jgi:hypothetical protein